MVSVVGGQDVRWVWVGDVNHFHGATNVTISPTRQLEVNDLIHGAEGASTNATLDKVSIPHGASDEGGFGIGSGQAVRRGGQGHSEGGQMARERTLWHGTRFIRSMRGRGAMLVSGG